MKIDIRRVRPDEMGLLCELDVKIFGDDGFDTPELWDGLEMFFIVADDSIVGSTALRHHGDMSDDSAVEYPYLKGSLYIVSTGVLPKWQGKGLGKIVKAWQIDYVRQNGFTRIVTNARVSNFRSIELNKKFGLKTVRTIAGYYENPNEDAVILDLNF